MKLWSGRFEKDPDKLVEELNASIGFDARMYREDITGSIAHAGMLGAQGIIEPEEAEKIIAGLREILAEIEAGKIEFTAETEDIHMSVETELTKRIGDAGKRLHTGFSVVLAHTVWFAALDLYRLKGLYFTAMPKHTV